MVNLCRDGQCVHWASDQQRWVLSHRSFRRLPEHEKGVIFIKQYSYPVKRSQSIPPTNLSMNIVCRHIPYPCRTLSSDQHHQGWAWNQVLVHATPTIVWSHADRNKPPSQHSFPLLSVLWVRSSVNHWGNLAMSLDPGLQVCTVTEWPQRSVFFNECFKGKIILTFLSYFSSSFRSAAHKVRVCWRRQVHLCIPWLLLPCQMVLLRPQWPRQCPAPLPHLSQSSPIVSCAWEWFLITAPALLVHHRINIQDFGAPDGLRSSITAVKKPLRAFELYANHRPKIGHSSRCTSRFHRTRNAAAWSWACWSLHDDDDDWGPIDDAWPMLSWHGHKVREPFLTFFLVVC